MEAVSAESARQWRDQQRGRPPRTLKPCGTYAAYRRHQRNGEPIDQACYDAYLEQQREMYRRRKEKS